MVGNEKEGLVRGHAEIPTLYKISWGGGKGTLWKTDRFIMWHRGTGRGGHPPS